ncbi:phospholipid-translocating P-type ATPase [Basidiobolus meristosporus CBS 931.73]|uniref:Phospholipid-transporting ATPase n=1 Tax=Basidiobolus meristosporus CBS 931.73 TaxID=1314790 RepID=A0A1Y1YY99_9FUNG|nr:phospholipid-translocating P-type ATPase [Basidiobolus meristosporus CBS 931.73]|eukprot:ORY03000.1 phospholipid-translocating P-type ATPase [Basidiobolus meristosporus CBS 931.73]
MRLSLGSLEALYTNVKQSLLRRWHRNSPVEDPDAPRQVFANNQIANSSFPRNKITNTKYTVLSFLPKNLFEQFSRFMNLYFLLIACLQLNASLTPVNPLTTWTPLIMIFSISALKEGLDDYRRYKSDDEFNKRLYTVYKNGHGVKVRCQDIGVGDIVRGPKYPAIWFYCDPRTLDGTCYIQTANLDGETDLKTRTAPSLTSSLSDTEVIAFDGVVHCPQPNGDIYKFDARLESSPESGEFSALTSKQLLLQGTFLKNTNFAYGLAVYTGNETKIGMNKRVPPVKLTKIDRQVERASMMIFVIQLCLVLLNGIIGDVQQESYFKGRHTYPERRKPFSMDICKYMYAMFINWDLKMYTEKSGGAFAANTAISEDLGQIDYIFTDKTGTLTENVMVLKKCSIGGAIFGHAEGCNDLRSDEILLDLLQNSRLSITDKKHTQKSNEIVDFFRCLAVCNTITPSEVFENGRPVYRGSSPDEEALVMGAADIGIMFTGKSNDVVHVDLVGRKEAYQVLNVLEFSSDRKRMSVIIREYSSNPDEANRKARIRLITKGADDSMLHHCEGQEERLEATTRHLNEFAQLGLRTLIVAHRDLTPEEYQSWSEEFHEANTSLEDRDAKLEECYNSIETKFTLLGCTAIEDKLQENVAESIALFREAGIKLWMLTGDKLTTAIQVSCNLLSSNQSTLVRLEGRGKSAGELLRDVEQAIYHHRTTLTSGPSLESLHTDSAHESYLSVVIDGSAFTTIAEDQGCSEKFLELCLLAHTVVCCRVTPNQKSQIVTAIKEKGFITLSIGDGGNDVLMIQQANVGVGIRGREGLQAARAADYSITKFEHLQRLILVHGRYSLHRTSMVALYCFYKSIYVCMIQILYQIMCGFSGTSLLNSFSLTTYNTLFTELPILFYILDQDVEESVVFEHPSVYQSNNGRSKRLVLNGFSPWIVKAIFQAVVTLLFCVGIFSSWESVSGFGNDGHETMSAVVFTVIMMVVQLTLALETNYFTILNHLVVWGTIGFYFAISYVISLVPALGMYHVIHKVYGEWMYWLAITATSIVCMIPLYVQKYVQVQYKPSMSDLLREQASISPSQHSELWFPLSKLYCLFRGNRTTAARNYQVIP